MKNKFLLISILTIVAIFAVNAYAIGKNDNANVSRAKNSDLRQSTSTISTTSITTERNDDDSDDNNKWWKSTSTTSTTSTKGQINAEQHRSVVANFVQNLLKTASSTEGGIGQQVRVIAQQQNQSASTTIQAIENVQTRSKIKTFFFGTDYKNLGELRSEISQTKNRLEQLKRLLESTQNEADKIELRNQIQVLEQEQQKIENFIDIQANKFSLFGWLIKLFQ